jgi:hypothetical protein
MKKILAFATMVLLVSCGTEYNVKLPNGAVVRAMDRDSRDFKEGDTVCILIDSYGARISNSGTMKDTTEYPNTDVETRFRIGIIKK